MSLAPIVVRGHGAVQNKERDKALICDTELSN